ncbi:glycosyltransferase [bacterium]|nr:glycosyltransferase [bacterium]
MAKVSVVIPVYNSEKYLVQCVDSVVNQTLKDLEIIFVDDGSTDNSLNILERYQKSDSRIKIIKQLHQNAGIARNNGILQATGEYIHFLDSDDFLDLDSYEKLYNIIKNNDADIVKFKTHRFDNKKKETTASKYCDLADIGDEYFNQYLTMENNAEIMLQISDAPWSGIYKLAFLKEYNIIFDDLKCANDTGFFFRCLLHAKKFYLSPQKFVYYRMLNYSSLLYARPYNYDCQIKLCKNVEKDIKDVPEKIKEAIHQRILFKLFNSYRTYMKEKSLKYNVKINIANQVYDYIHSFKEIPVIKGQEDMLPLLKKSKISYNLAHLKYSGFYRFLQDVFSIKNNNSHKVISILGLKIKIKKNK